MCGFVGFTGYLENRDHIIKKMADRIIRIEDGHVLRGGNVND